MALDMIDFAKIEKKWQNRWAKEKVFEVNEKSKKPKYYVLEMYPYPSGSGLHMGHAFNYTIADIQARLKIMQGFNVLHPMGFDSFGLPAENAAIKAKSHPKKFTEDAIKNYIEQMKGLGLSYDWTRKVESHDPSYYKWDQWIFLKMFEKGLAYRKKAPVNWCPLCNTVLANEQVVNGKCWRHEDTDVQVKHLEQWFFKTTEYADELYEKLDSLTEWPEQIRKLQKNWIGKSYGTEIDFEVPWSKETNFILLHGYTADPNEDFHPWLKKELESKGYRVSAPELPNTNNPKVVDQVKYVLDNCEFNEDTVLLGHSLGGAVALKVVESLDKPIKKLILAAGFVEVVENKPYSEAFDWKFDFNKIKNNAKEIILLRDEGDTEIPKTQAEIMSKKLGGRIIDFTAEDEHITGKKEPVVLHNCLNNWKVFTTRPDTLFGVTFLAVSVQHPDLMSLVTVEQKKDVEAFLKKVKSTKEEDMDKLDKEGVFTGSYAKHPLTNQDIPIWTGNFVVADYGSGMVMAVPAHDQRDFEFAKKYNLSIKQVVKPLDEVDMDKKAYTGFGKLVNSEGFSDLMSDEAKEHIRIALEEKGKGRKTVKFRLRDWLVSRQRFWGTPIPIIYCDDCGAVPVPEKDLPVKLPDNIKFDSVENPLKNNDKFVKVKCPKCNGNGRRETDTMDTFVNSSWYFLRYTDPHNEKQIFDPKKANYWMPIDIYVGGREHATLHMIYSRFYTKFLRDLGLINVDEPVVRLFNQGFISGEDGRKMSKSYGNVINPSDMIVKYGTDALRMFLISVASPDNDFNWDTKGMEGSLRFVLRVINFFKSFKPSKLTELAESKLHRTIRDYTNDLENFRYNLAIIKLRELFTTLEEGCDRKSLEIFLKLLSPICPHIAEELWSKLGNKTLLSVERWPSYDEKKINEKLEALAKQVDKTVEDILNIVKIIEDKGNKAKKVYLYVLPQELSFYDSEKLSNRVNKEVIVYSVSDKNKHDPEEKSKKVKPGRPGIYIE